MNRRAASVALAIALCLFLIPFGSTPPAAGAPAAQSQGQGRPIDDVFAQVAERFPGFGGVFVDASGVLNVYLVDPHPRTAADVVAALRQALRPGSIPTARIQARRGLFTFHELKAWHDRMQDLLDLDGVVFTDVDDARNRLTVGVQDYALLPAVEGELARLGVPREAVEIIETEPVQFETSLQSRHRPLVGGLQISFVSKRFAYLCTLGFNATRLHVAGFVLNSHCTAKQGGVEDTVIYQERVGNQNVVGVEVADPEYFTGGICPKKKRCRYSDSAFAERSQGVDATRGAVAKVGLNSVAWDGGATFSIVGGADPIVGHTVGKVGRTTGFTEGTVQRICTNYGVLTTKIVLLCQAQASYSSSGGDSGSPVFSRPGDSITLHGIHWGSGGVFSPISGIERESELGALIVR